MRFRRIPLFFALASNWSICSGLNTCGGAVSCPEFAFIAVFRVLDAKLLVWAILGVISISRAGSFEAKAMRSE